MSKSPHSDQSTAANSPKDAPRRRASRGRRSLARTTLILGAVSAGVTVMAAASPAKADSGAPVQHVQAVRAATGGQVAIPIRLTPGQHAVIESTSPGSAAALPVTSDASPQIQVRVGKNNCAGYNGDWDLEPVDTGVGIVNEFSTWGTIWDDCGQYTRPTTVYLYINFGGGLNPGYQGPTASGTGDVSAGVNTGWVLASALPPPQIVADACLKWNAGWGCGPSQKL